jgi:hypothetical protein
MVDLFPTRRRAEELSRALAGEPVAADARLQELLDTVSRLAAVPLVEPRAGFRESLRVRLMDVAAAELPGQAALTDADAGEAHDETVVVDDPRAARRRRRLVAAATGLVIVGGGAGVAAASEQALPGDMLYPVKRTLESAQVTLAQGAAAEGRALLDRAATRLDEAEALSADLVAGTGGLAGLTAALDDFAADASSGGDRLLESYAASGDPAELAEVRDFTTESHRVLAELAETLPPQAQSEVILADDTVVTLDGLAERACPDCTSLPPLVSLPTQPVSDVDRDAVANRSGVSTPDRQRTEGDRRRGEGGRSEAAPRRQRSAGSPGARGPGAGQGLPDLGLHRPGGRAEPRQQDAAGDQGGDNGPQGGPGVELRDVLDPAAPGPAPAPPRRTVDAPTPGDLDVPRDLDDVTEPLRPLRDRVRDGARDTVKRTRNGLDNLL